MTVMVVGLASFATAILSALAGLGGGIVLLAVLAQFFTPATAIPIHGGIQLISNGSRSAMLRDEIDWSAVGWSCLLLLPASFLGVALATSVPQRATSVLIAVFALVVAWRPSLLKWKGKEALPDRAMIWVGALSGFLGATVGATGPVISPFFKAVTASHRAFVATAGAAQLFAHGSKVFAFSLDEFAISDHFDVIGIGAVGVIGGSFIGTKLLGRIDETHLDLVFRLVLTSLAVRLLLP